MSSEKPAGKPGLKSTEFWATMGTNVLLTLTFMTGKLTPDLFVAGLTGTTAVYGGIRTVAKVKAGKQ